MKREQFLITSTEGHNVIKYKWNSSCREVENIVGQIAKEESSYWELVNSECEKEGKFHVSGMKVWQRADGKQISFFITKLKD